MTVMVISFGECPFPPPVEIRSWCLLWHGWLPLLSGVNRGSPWAENPGEGVGNLLECALGAYTSGLLLDWQLPVGFDAGGAAGRVSDEPDIWTDGCLVQGKVSGASSSGSFFFTRLAGQLWANRRWGHLDDELGRDRGHSVLPWLMFCSWSVTDCSEGRVLGRSLLRFRLLIVFTLGLII